ncbi:hypothetical protein PR202_gb13661 [Eleusine coracana subsp. coracana]|uniref:Uncharacterized protein n=1 Tax=Eleusine coracana subsp. coracana TaxID=191504 RepID=A0AAV5ESJ8_ELECO|nr:hypothetical protein PR202_gb13661 [Eleusine coracana subsp. coracana]
MDGTIAVYDAVRMKFLHHLEGHHMPVRSMVFSPVDPHVLFTASDDCHIHIYDAKEKSLIDAMSGHASWVLSIDVSPDGMAVASGSSDRTVWLWDINTRASVQMMSNHSDQVWACGFSTTWRKISGFTKSRHVLRASPNAIIEQSKRLAKVAMEHYNKTKKIKFELVDVMPVIMMIGHKGFEIDDTSRVARNN